MTDLEFIIGSTFLMLFFLFSEDVKVREEKKKLCVDLKCYVVGESTAEVGQAGLSSYLFTVAFPAR